jgi:hypothetical protein
VDGEQAVVRYDPDRATVDQMSRALERAGYKGWDSATEKRKRATGRKGSQ